MRIAGKEYRTIWYEDDVVKIIDQTKLPHNFIIKDLETVDHAINAIKSEGVIVGSLMALKRILSCHPFGKKGYDPILKKTRK